jgi:hypothetical protein
MIVIGDSPQLLVAGSGWSMQVPPLVAGSILAAHVADPAAKERKPVPISNGAGDLLRRVQH